MLVECDVTRLRQILVNLLDNAVKFTASGEVSAGVEVLSREGGRVELRFRVRDTGIGIPADRRERLFQPFSQADSSTTRLYGGTGLGLAISRRLAEGMGGRMWVESEVGGGSVFSFTILGQAAPRELPPYLAARPPELAGRRLLQVTGSRQAEEILRWYADRWGRARDGSAPRGGVRPTRRASEA